MKNRYRKHLLTLAGVWAGATLLCVLTYMFVITPQTQTHMQYQSQVDESRQLYEKAVAASKTETKIKLQDEVEQLYERLEGFMAEPENSANLTFDIGRMASEKDLAAFAIKAVDDTKGDARKLDSPLLKQDQIEVRFESNWVQFAAFLNALERNKPVVFIDRFRIVRSTDGKSNHKVDMDLAIFVRKKEQT